MTAKDSPPTPPSKKALAIVFFTVFIDLLGFGIVLPLVPRYAQTFQASGLTIGLLMSSFSAMQFIFAPLWGRLSDRIGRRPVIIAGLAGSTICYALFGYATSLGNDGTIWGWGVITWLFISRIGAGIGGATISTAQAFIADVTGRKERSKGMALIGFAFGMGFTFGPLIGAGFVYGVPKEAPPPPAPGYAAAVLSGLAMLWAIISLPQSLSQRTGPITSDGHGWNQLARLGQALGKPMIGATLIASFLTVVAFAQFESTLSLLTKHLGLDDFWNFLVFAYIGLVLSLALGGIVRRVAPRLGEFRMARIGVTLLILGLALIGATGYVKSLAFLMTVVPLAVLGFAFANTAFQANLSLHSSADEQGGILGLGQSVSAVGRIAGPVIGLKLNDYGVSTPYWCAAGIMVLALLVTRTLRPTAGRPGP